MKIFTLNAPRTALNFFAGLCVLTLIYFGFVHNREAVAVSGEPANTSYLAIIINGFGYGGVGVREFLYMDIPFTGGVIPGAPHTEDETRRLVANGKDVMIHMPMEARNMRGVWLPDIHIMNSHTKAEARAALLKAIDQIPSATGITNRYDSKVMDNEDLLTTILSTAMESNLYFVDSLAANRSKASEISEELGARVYIADIVLDGSSDVRRIERNLRRAARMADENGFAIAIGHIGPEGGRATAQAIHNMREELAQKGVVLVTMSELSQRMQ